MTEAAGKRLADVTLDELTTAVIEAISAALISVMLATGQLVAADDTTEGEGLRHLNG